MTEETNRHIMLANNEFTQARATLDPIESGMDEVMNKVRRIEALIGRVVEWSGTASECINTIKTEHTVQNDSHTKEALEDLRTVGITPENKNGGSFFSDIYEAALATRRAMLEAQKLTGDLEFFQAAIGLKAQGSFISLRNETLKSELKTAKLHIDDSLDAGNSYGKEA